MSYKAIRIEAMTHILSDLGIRLSQADVETIVENFSNHIEMEREMESYRHVGGGKSECDNCKRLTSENKDLKKEVEIYQNSVKQRRHAERVWIEGDSVKYE